MSKANHVVLYSTNKEQTRPATYVGHLYTDDKGRIVFEDFEKTFRFMFIDADDSGSLAEILKHSTIAVNREQVYPELFDLSNPTS